MFFNRFRRGYYGETRETPLQLAVKKRNLSLVTMLLQAGANPNVQRELPKGHDTGERQALRLAVYYYCEHPETGTDIIDELLKHGADPTIALRDSIKKNNLIMTKYLLEKGANPMADPENKGKGIDVAAAQVINRTADLTIVKLLLESGATVGFNGPNICPYEYRPTESALSQAIKMRSLELLKLLLRNGGKQALRAKFTAHPVSKIRCPIDHEAHEIMTTIGAEENGLFLTFECKNNELAAALTACMRPRAALEDYYCYYYESDYGDYYLDFGEEKEDVRRAKGSKKSLYRTKRPHFKDRKPRRAHPDDYSLSG